MRFNFNFLFLVLLFMNLALVMCGESSGELNRLTITYPTDGMTMNQWKAGRWKLIEGTVFRDGQKRVAPEQVEVHVWILTDVYYNQGQGLIQDTSWSVSNCWPSEMTKNVIVATLHKQNVDLPNTTKNLERLPDLLAISNRVTVLPFEAETGSILQGRAEITKVSEDVLVIVAVNIMGVPKENYGNTYVNFWYGISNNAWYPQGAATVAELEAMNWQMHLPKRNSDEVVVTINNRFIKPSEIEYIPKHEGNLTRSLRNRGIDTGLVASSYQYHRRRN